MFIFSNEDVESLLSVEICLVAVERAYLAWAAGTGSALAGVTFIYIYHQGPPPMLTCSNGRALLDPPIAALRLNSDLIR